MTAEIAAAAQALRELAMENIREQTTDSGETYRWMLSPDGEEVVEDQTGTVILRDGGYIADDPAPQWAVLADPTVGLALADLLDALLAIRGHHFVELDKVRALEDATSVLAAAILRSPGGVT